MSKIMKYQSKVARIQNDVTVYLIIKKKRKRKTHFIGTEFVLYICEDATRKCWVFVLLNNLNYYK